MIRNVTQGEVKRSIFSSIIHYGIAVPCDFIRNLSIPPSSEENWSRWRASIFPLPTLFVFYLMTERIFFQIVNSL